MRLLALMFVIGLFGGCHGPTEYVDPLAPDKGRDGCLTDSDCPVGERCATDTCLPETEECADNNDCNDGDICAAGDCRNPPECRSHADCGRGYCEDGICFEDDVTPTIHYRFLLIEDLTDPVAGEFPGADLDAVELIKQRKSHFAHTLEDFNVPDRNNLRPDPVELLGPPDADCDPESAGFVCLGGAAAGGFVIVGFGTVAEDVVIENGDVLRVYELGRTLCGRFDDDEVTLTVAYGTTLQTFWETGVPLGEAGSGSYEVRVGGL